MNTQQKKTSVILYTEQMIGLYEVMNKTDIADLLLAIMNYVNTGNAPQVGEYSDAVRMAFALLKLTIDNNNAKFQARCERNRTNGKKGGRPRKNAAAAKKEKAETVAENSADNEVIQPAAKNPEKPTKSLNENENENEVEETSVSMTTTPSAISRNEKPAAVVVEKIRKLGGKLSKDSIAMQNLAYSLKTTAEEATQLCTDVLHEWEFLAKAGERVGDINLKHLIATARIKQNARLKHSAIEQRNLNALTSQQRKDQLEQQRMQELQQSIYSDLMHIQQRQMMERC
ncbi:MAG: DUF6291 domain-containing protein [Bacteroidales bacterium]|nr:DUF6291 domain-containing protein [Bacteroidales bacterium]